MQRLNSTISTMSTGNRKLDGAHTAPPLIGGKSWEKNWVEDYAKAEP
jgi:hypothetical protein